METYNTFVGMDVHKNSIEIATAQVGRDGEVKHYARIDASLSALDKVVRKLVSQGKRPFFVYEAGPCGYEIYRHLTSKGYKCEVIAPSKTPRKSGDRIKTDRRDACALARSHRSGDLTPICVPDPEDEAMRDLTRARESMKEDEIRCKQRLTSFLLYHGYTYTGKTTWSQAHMRWLSDLKMPHESQQIVLQECIDAINESKQRVQRLTDQIRELLPKWKMNPVVEALQAMRGVSMIIAVTTVAEIGDFTRFFHPKELMGYLGLVPSEHTTGKKIKKGPITKTGNSHVRWNLIQAAWTYRFPARVSRAILKRQEGLPQKVIEIAWKAQVRLCSRQRRLRDRGKPQQVITTAIARELCGFIWAIAMEVLAPSN
jgi:transposase